MSATLIIFQRHCRQKKRHPCCAGLRERIILMLVQIPAEGGGAGGSGREGGETANCLLGRPGKIALVNKQNKPLQLKWE